MTELLCKMAKYNFLLLSFKGVSNLKPMEEYVENFWKADMLGYLLESISSECDIGIHDSASNHVQLQIADVVIKNHQDKVSIENKEVSEEVSVMRKTLNISHTFKDENGKNRDISLRGVLEHEESIIPDQEIPDQIDVLLPNNVDNGNISPKALKFVKIDSELISKQHDGLTISSHVLDPSLCGLDFLDRFIKWVNSEASKMKSSYMIQTYEVEKGRVFKDRSEWDIAEVLMTWSSTGRKLIWMTTSEDCMLLLSISNYHYHGSASDFRFLKFPLKDRYVDLFSAYHNEAEQDQRVFTVQMMVVDWPWQDLPAILDQNMVVKQNTSDGLSLDNCNFLAVVVMDTGQVKYPTGFTKNNIFSSC